MRRIVWTAEEWRKLKEHFEAAGRLEAGAFFLFRTGNSTTGQRLIVDRVLLPPAGALDRQGPDTFRPSGQWLSAVIGSAIDGQCGLGFIHSHPHPHHPPILSALDWETSIEWSKSITPTLDAPFASLVWSPRGVTGIMFSKAAPAVPLDVERAESIGGGAVNQLHPVGVSNEDESSLDDRQIRTLSELGNRRLRELKVAVIGAGGTGSPVAEQLVRIGVAQIVLVDHDQLEEPSNIRRVVGSRLSDLGKSKVGVVGQYLESLGLSTAITVIPFDLRTEIATRQILDCDIAISTTDTQASRSHLNQLAYQYYFPVIDVGIRIGTNRRGIISGMPVEVRALLPDNGCLWCRDGVLDSQRIYEENLPIGERTKLAAEGYIQGLVIHQPSITPLNYFAAGLALITMIRLYSGAELVHQSSVIDPWEQFVHPLQAQIKNDCICKRWRGKGDQLPIAFLPRLGSLASEKR